MFSKEQLIERRKSIGGSEISAVLGINPWRTPLQLYMEKRGEIEPQPENMAMRLGTKLEPIIRELYEEETGNKVTLQPETIYHPEYNFLSATVDGLVGDNKILEIKKVGYDSAVWGEQFTDNIPDYYITQVQQYMAIYDRDEADLAALVSGNDFRIYNIKRDDDLIKMMFTIASEFWEMVQNGTPPAIKTTEDWQLRFSKQLQDNAVEANDTDLQALKKLYSVNRQIKELEEQKQALNVQLMQRLESNKTIAYSGSKLGGITVRNAVNWDLDALSTDADLVAKYKTKVSNSAYFQIARTKNINEILGVI